MRISPKIRLLLLGAVLILLSCTRTYTKEEIDILFKPITSKYGIKIVYEIDAEFSPIRIGGRRAQFSKLEAIDNRDLARYGIILKKALAKYPVQVIKAYLNTISISKTMEIDGFQLGGTYDRFRKIVYLANNGRLDDDQAIANFHHEFSSLLLGGQGFFVNPWLEHNPKGFKYRNEIFKDRNEEYENTTLIGTDDDYEKGFMNTYGQTNFENDFNEYAAMIFTNPQKFKKIMNQYPRVRGKFRVFLEFYHEIDPIFTEAYLLGDK